MQDILFLLALASPVAALVTCLLCRRPQVLLLLGGLVMVAGGACLVATQGGHEMAVGIGLFMMCCLMLIAGIILLIGALVRWSSAQMAARND